MTKNNILLVAAAEFEIDPLRHGFLEHSQHALVGIGALQAAKNAHALSGLASGKDVVFVGSCGTFGKFSGLELVRATRVLWSPTSDRLGDSYTIDGSANPYLTPEPPLWSQFLRPVTVLCSPSISTTARLPDDYNPASCVENIELYSCVQELLNCSKSFVAILAITNAIGKDAHQQWRENYLEAARKTADFVASSLSSSISS